MQTTENIIKSPRSSRPRPENDFAEGEVLLTGEKTDLRSRLLAMLGKVTGSNEDEVAEVLGIAPQKRKNDPRKATCPQCRRKFRVFDHYDDNLEQDMCPACKDEELKPAREAAQAPEREAAKARIDQEAKLIADEKAAKHEETARIAADTTARVLAEVIPQLLKQQKAQ